MKVSIITVGTRGDIQPYIALGLGLKKNRYDVQIITAQNEKEFVENYGLNFYPLSVDIQKLMDSGDLDDMAKGDNPIKFMISHFKGTKGLNKLMIKTQAEIWEGCQNADLIIYHPGMPIGFFIAQEQRKISVMANPFPIIATKDYPSLLFYTGPRFGRLYNLFNHFLFDKLFWSLSKPALLTFWKKEIKSKMNFSTSPIKQQIESGMPVINGYSGHLFQQSKDWAKNIHTTGSWIIENEPNFTPPTDLLNFIENGKAPIYIGFGSMKNINNFIITFEIIIKALEKTGQKAVVGLGWSNLNYTEPVPKNIYLVEAIAHTWLFPKMKLVIHHGGAGTTATGLTAGKPTIIIPHNADQPAWGQRVFELRVGSKPIRKTNLTAENLATAIDFALQPNIIENAKQLGQILRDENGVNKAVNIIVDFLKSNSTTNKAN